MRADTRRKGGSAAARRRAWCARPPGFAYLLAILAAGVLTCAVLVLVDETSIELAMAGHRSEAAQAEWLARAAVHQAAWRMVYDEPFRRAVNLGLAAPVTQTLATGEYGCQFTKAGRWDWIVAGAGSAGGASFTSRQRAPDSLLVRRVSVPCVADAVIYEANPNVNYGAYPELTLRVAPGSRARLLLFFDFAAAAFPPGATIQSAILEMWLVEAQGDETVKAEVHDMQVSWLEGTKSGSGTADGATWYERSPYWPWGHPGAGGDYGPPKGSADVPLKPGLCRWDIGGVVKEWIRGSRVNCGMLIRARDEKETLPTIERRVFASRERDGGAHLPVITIAYTASITYALP